MWFLGLLQYFHPALVNDCSSSGLLGNDAPSEENLLPARVGRINGLPRLHPYSCPWSTHVVIDHNKVTVVDSAIAAGAARNTNVNANKFGRVGKRAFKMGHLELTWVLYALHERGTRSLWGRLAAH